MNFSPEQANGLLFATAALFDQKDKDELFDFVQEARIKGDWDKVIEQTIVFLYRKYILGLLGGEENERP